MKVAFWSNGTDTLQVSHSLSAISVASILRYPYSITVLENYLYRENLGLSYFGNRKARMLLEFGTNYYEGVGIEGLLRKIYREPRKNVAIRPYLQEVVRKHLYYIPQSQNIHSELFDYELNENLDRLYQLLNDTSNITFINVAPNNLSTKTILDRANLIVVNLSQNPVYIQDFFENYSSLIPKSIFIINNYSKDSIIHYKSLIHKYGIKQDQITRIPYNEQFIESYHMGRVVEFMLRHYKCESNDSNYLYIQGIRRITSMIMNRVYINQQLMGKESKIVD